MIVVGKLAGGDSRNSPYTEMYPLHLSLPIPRHSLDNHTSNLSLLCPILMPALSILGGRRPNNWKPHLLVWHTPCGSRCK